VQSKPLSAICSLLPATSIAWMAAAHRMTLPGLLLIFLLLTPLNSYSSDLKTNLPKYTTLHLTPPIFDEHLTFSDQMTSLSKACYYHIRQLRCIRHYLDSPTACTIATSIVHSKLDYCNSLYYNLPKSQLFHIQQIQDSLSRMSLKLPSHVISLKYQSHPTLSPLAQDH